MKRKNNLEQKKGERTPIIDGDTRPDQQDNQNTPAGSSSAQEKKVTSNRGADRNSLENFKDGK